MLEYYNIDMIEGIYVNKNNELHKLVKSFLEIFRSGWDVLIRSTANFIVAIICT